ncbi:hypothetical protein H7R52_02750 [Weissella confusa]|uniref:Uncharacterized protein n=1 Tax=Weissella confusa TaxID=1583 RepID=A0A923SMQ1_WEICO|nr:hypothetical protein [Weissella confusa]
MAYAVVLGVADKVADALRQAQLEPVDDMSNLVPIYVAYTMFSPSSVSAFGVASSGSDTLSSAHIAGWFIGVSVGLSVLIAVVAFAMAVKIRQIYTVEGWPIAEAWFGFGRMLRDVGQFEVKQVP